MGVGNYYCGENAETVYIPHDQVHEDEEDQDSRYFRYDDLLENIKAVLPKNFCAETGEQWLGNDRGKLLAESGFYWLTIVSWEGYYALNLIAKDCEYYEPWDVNPLGRYHLPKTAAKIFDALSEMYKLRIRCSAWCSGEYEVTKGLVA